MEAFFDRRSIRQYQNKPVEKEKIDQVILAAMYAPSAVNCQSWQFIVCDDKKIISDLHKMHVYTDALITAPVCIVVCGDANAEFSKDYHLIDCSLAAENLMLCAQKLGLGTCFHGIAPGNLVSKPITKYFGLPENIKPFCLLSLGYPDEQKERPQRYDESKVHHNKW